MEPKHVLEHGEEPRHVLEGEEQPEAAVEVVCEESGVVSEEESDSEEDVGVVLLEDAAVW